MTNSSGGCCLPLRIHSTRLRIAEIIRRAPPIRGSRGRHQRWMPDPGSRGLRWVWLFGAGWEGAVPRSRRGYSLSSTFCLSMFLSLKNIQASSIAGGGDLTLECDNGDLCMISREFLYPAVYLEVITKCLCRGRGTPPPCPSPVRRYPVGSRVHDQISVTTQISANLCEGAPIRVDIRSPDTFVMCSFMVLWCIW